MINTEKSQKDALLKKIANWTIEHPNSYDGYTKEKVYHTFNDLSILLQEDNVSENTIQMCEQIFDRFKNYY